MTVELKCTRFIDSRGKVSRATSGALASALGLKRSAPGILSFAVENVGFVAIEEQASRAHVRYRPAITSESTAGGLYFWLLAQQCKPIAVSWYDGAVWNLQSFSDPRSAMTFIAYSLEQHSHAQARGARIIARASKKAVGRLKAAEMRAAKPVAHCARDPSDPSLLNELFLNRWSVINVNLSTHDVFVTRQGSGNPPLDPVFASGQGYSFGQFGDESYGDWLSNCMTDAAMDMKPKYEDVDAIVKWPRLGDLRTRYWRAIIPVSRNDSFCTLLSVSGSDSSINLRQPNVHKASYTM